MSEFSTSGSVHIEVDQGSLREAKDDVESELGSVQIEINALPNSGRFQDRIQRAAENAEAVVDPNFDEEEIGSVQVDVLPNSNRFQDRLERAAENADVVVDPGVDEDSVGSISLDAEQATPDGGVTGMGADAATIDELNEQTDLLEDLLDEVEDGAGGGLGGGGGAAGAGAGGGGGGGGGGGLLGKYLQFKGAQKLLGGAGIAAAAGKTGALLGGGVLGATMLASPFAILGDLMEESPGSRTEMGREQRAEYFPEFEAEDFISDEQWESRKEELANMPEDEMTRSPSSITEMLENNPEKVTDIGQAPGRDMAELTLKGGETATVDPDKLPMDMYQTYMGVGSDNQQNTGAETPTGMWGGPTDRRPGGTYGGRARGLPFNERLYSEVTGAGGDRTRPGPDTGGRTAGPGAEINAPVQVDVTTETPSAETVASQVTRQVKPEIKRELQRWLKRDGATNISDEQQSNYQEGF